MRKRKQNKKILSKVSLITCLVCIVFAANIKTYASNEKTVNNNSIISAIKTQKTVTKTDKQGEYEITLKMSKDADIEIKPVDIVMIMDTSGSMKDDIRNLKSTMNNFVDKIIDNVSNSRISVIGFSGHGIEYGGDDEDDDDDEDGDLVIGSKNDARLLNGFSSDKNVIKDSYAKVKAKGLTDAQSAWLLAEKELSKANPNSNKYVIFFTDGMPNLLVNHPSNTDSTKDMLNNVIPYTEETYNNILEQYPKLKTFSVGLIKNVSKKHRKYATEFLKNMQNSGDFILNGGSDELESVYDQIADNIIINNQMAYSSILKDVVSANFEIVKDGYGVGKTSLVTNPINPNEYLNIKENIDGNNISWNLGDLGNEGRIVKFKIRCKDDYFGGQNIYTNDSATMKYINPINKENSEVVFNRPTVNIPYKKGSITIGKKVESTSSSVDSNEKFAITLDGGKSGKYNVELKNGEVKNISFYLKNNNTDISNNDDVSLNYLNVGTYKVTETVPMNYELKEILINGKRVNNNEFIIDKDNENIKIEVVNKYNKNGYFNDKDSVENKLKFNS